MRSLNVSLAGRRWAGLAGIGAALIADQATKLMALAALEPGSVQFILPFFNLRLSFNPGISFSLFAQTFVDRPWLLAAITLFMAGLLTILLIRSASRTEAAALGLIIGGALGNAADRFRLGAVVDFLDLHIGAYHWPAFNLADTAIAVGAMLLLSSHFFSRPVSASSRENPS